MVFGAWFSGQHKLGRWNPPTRFHRKIERLKADHIDHGYVQQTYDDLAKPKGLRSVISLVSILDFWWLQLGTGPSCRLAIIPVDKSTCRLLPCNVQVALQPQQFRMNNVGQLNRLNRSQWTKWTKWDCIHHPSSSIIHHHPSSMCRIFPQDFQSSPLMGRPDSPISPRCPCRPSKSFLYCACGRVHLGELWVSQFFSLRTCHQQLTNNDN